MADVVVDMHTHTTCSDGVLTPSELVTKAKARGLVSLAVTDHDTIAGVRPATTIAQDLGVTIIPGVELSIRFLGRELHLLGYYFDVDHGGLHHFLQGYQRLREERAQAIVGRLNKLGIGLTFEDVLARADGGAIGRPHIAAALVARKFVDTIPQAFLRYLRNRGPADVEKSLPLAKDAISLLHDAGGIAVLAHPGHWVSDKDLERLQDLGLDGVEIIHPSHDESLVEFYTDVAHKLSLLTTGGSDFHGMREGDEKNLGRIGLTEEQFQSFKLKRAA